MEIGTGMLPVAVAVVGATLVVLTLWQVPIAHNRSLSQHIMQSSIAKLQGAILLSLAGLLLWLWVILLNTSMPIKIAIALAGLSYLVTGIVPYGTNKLRNAFHDIGAWLGLIAMLVVNLLLASSLSGGAAAVAAVGAGLQVIIIISFLATKPGQRRFMLLGQVSYLAAFLASIITFGLVGA